MDDQQLGILLGEIKQGVKANGDRMDRHNKEHDKLDIKVDLNTEGLTAIKAKAGLIAFITSTVVAVFGWLLRYGK